jgi:hypothetical protein
MTIRDADHHATRRSGALNEARRKKSGMCNKSPDTGFAISDFLTSCVVGDFLFF